MGLIIFGVVLIASFAVWRRKQAQVVAKGTAARGQMHINVEAVASGMNLGSYSRGQAVVNSIYETASQMATYSNAPHGVSIANPAYIGSSKAKWDAGYLDVGGVGSGGPVPATGVYDDPTYFEAGVFARERPDSETRKGTYASVPGSGVYDDPTYAENGVFAGERPSTMSGKRLERVAYVEIEDDDPFEV